jgi:flavin reductase (DIM6/NTAB) family NADH-FMN oxidoreductase RutF
MEQFVNVRKVDNFYQTSSYYPMPIVLVSTLSETGQANLGPYSLCFPHVVAGKHAMMLIARNNSNTAMNIKRTCVAAINFIPFDKKFIKNCVMLGFPGETTTEKMKNSKFTIVPSQRGDTFPGIVAEAFQVFECTWDKSCDPYEDPDTLEIHFVLRVEKILMKPRWHDALIEGKAVFPSMPIDYGFRNNTSFWVCGHGKPYAEKIPKGKGQDINVVIYQAKRTDPDVIWEKEACEKLVKVPRVFLPKVLKACVDTAKAQGVTTITPAFLDKMRDKRSAEKGDRA